MIRSGYSKRGVAKGATGPASMHLPPNVYDLFDPRPPLLHWSTPKRRTRELPRDVSNVTERFEKETKVSEGFKPTEIPSLLIIRQEEKLLRQKKKDATRKHKFALHQENVAERIKNRDPQKEEEGKRKTKNAYNTLFVGRISSATTEFKVKSHFERYGKVSETVLIRKRHYAFIEFETENDFRKALKSANSSRLDGRTLIVDVERGRTVKDFLPKSLGMGVTSKQANTGDRNKRGYQSRDTYNDGYKRRRY